MHVLSIMMREKCCHDIDLYNMVTGSRPARVASFGGRKSCLPRNAPTSKAENAIMHVKPSIWNAVDDAFHADGDIIDFQPAILQYETKERESLPVGIVDAMEEGIAAPARDQARIEGRMRDLTETWARCDARGLRR
jgi:hypothetical protein